MESTVRAWLKETGDLTLAELCTRLAAHGIAITVPALWHQLDKWKLTFKKPRHASEHDRTEVQAARREWQAAQPVLDITKLVFLDETGASTNMARRDGRGARCGASVPHGHWHTTTVVAGLRYDDITAPMVADGAMTGALFLKYVQEFLCPTLHPGDLVIADHLRKHKVAGVNAAVEAVGAHLRYLPPYSPDLNPIEQLFAKLKTLLRKAAPRTVDALWTDIGRRLDCFTPDECTRYFASSGSVKT
jgi:transposase